MLVRIGHRSFFSAAAQGDDDGVRIARIDAHGSCWHEPRESVNVTQVSKNGHRQIVTGFSSQQKRIFRMISWVKAMSKRKIHPHENAKSLFLHGVDRS